jgi:hypothetical protein
MSSGIGGQKTCILRTDEKYDATWHHWAGKGYVSALYKLNLEDTTSKALSLLSVTSD